MISMLFIHSVLVFSVCNFGQSVTTQYSNSSITSLLDQKSDAKSNTVLLLTFIISKADNGSGTNKPRPYQLSAAQCIEKHL